ncbi:hypothetical protein EPN81_04520 [Patescibacteria group bacterium]|nr:MAG: hypothetical protein EPN81_04520 [Patescibacteria group bacterium]
MQTEELQINIGSPQLEWEVDEYPAHDRSKRWYIIAAVLGVSLIVYAVATANFLFAVIILMIGVITLLTSFVPPDRVPVVITNTGVVVSDMYYDFQAIKDFSIAYDPPHVKNLYFEFHSPWHPLLTVPLEDTDPNEVRDLLLPYCLENLQRVEENLTDVLRRLYKL